MEKYRETARCPKCGGQHVTTKHEESMGEEHMRRQCQRCGYSWLQKPLDSD